MEKKVDLSAIEQTVSGKEAVVVQVSKTMHFCPISWLYVPYGKIELTLTKYERTGKFSAEDYFSWKKKESVFEECPLRNFCEEVAKIADYGVFFCTDCVFNQYRKNEEKLAELKSQGQINCCQTDAVFNAIQNSKIERIEEDKVKEILRAACLPKKSIKKPEGGDIMGTEINTFYFEKQTAAVNLGKETIAIISLLGVGNLGKGTDESTQKRLAWYDDEARNENCILFKTCGMIIEALELPRHWCCGSCPFQDFSLERQAGIGEKLKKLLSDIGKIQEAEEKGVIVVSPHDLNGRIVWSMPENADEQKKDNGPDGLAYRIVKNGQMDMNKHSAKQVLEVFDNLLIKGTCKSVSIVRKVDDKFVPFDAEELRKKIETKKSRPVFAKIATFKKTGDSNTDGGREKSWNRNPLQKLVYFDGRLVEDLGRINPKLAIKLAQRKANELGQTDSAVQVYLIKTKRTGPEAKYGPFILQKQEENEASYGVTYETGTLKKKTEEVRGLKVYRLTINGEETIYNDKKKKDLVARALNLMTEGKIVVLERFKNGAYNNIPIVSGNKERKLQTNRGCRTHKLIVNGEERVTTEKTLSEIMVEALSLIREGKDVKLQRRKKGVFVDVPLLEEKVKQKSFAVEKPEEATPVTVGAEKPEETVAAKIVDSSSGDKKAVDASNMSLTRQNYTPDQLRVMLLENVFAEAGVGVEEARSIKNWQSGVPKKNGSDDSFLCVEQMGIGANPLGLMTYEEIVTRHEANQKLPSEMKLWFFLVTPTQIIAHSRAQKKIETERFNKILENMSN
jgi:hypothetical protein